MSTWGDLFTVINHLLLELCQYVVIAIALPHCERNPFAVSIVTYPRRFDLVIVLSCSLEMVWTKTVIPHKMGKDGCFCES